MGQLTSPKEKVANIRDLLQKTQGQIALALPKHMTADRMLRVVMTEVQKTPKLLECKPMSLIAAVVQASQLGLEVGVQGHAYLVPYGDQVTLIPGYRGLIELARRSGQILDIEARVVHAKDEFDFEFGLNASLRHKPNMKDEDPGPVVAAYAVARMAGGATHFEVMSVRELNAIRNKSKASKVGPWVDYTEEMYRKTAARRLCKWIPTSIELMTAMDLDNKVEAGLPQDLETIIDVPGEAVDDKPEAEAPKGALAGVTESLKAEK